MDYKIIALILVTAVISGLVTYFITNTTRRRGLEELKKKQDDFEKATTLRLETVSKEYQSIKVGLVFVVTRLGGNPADVGLM